MKRFPRMKVFWAAALLSGLLSASGSVLAEEFDRGQGLYENHCQFCHESWAHTRTGRKVGNLPELRKRVAAWSIHAGLDWSDAEIDDVTRYLNSEFYHLTD